MSFLQISSSRLGHDPDCRICGAGSTISFNWEYAKQTKRADAKRDLTIFIKPQALRWGTLFRCASCDQPWYLDGEARFMNFVPRDRIHLIAEWNEHKLLLKPEHLTKLEMIGRTPPDVFGNGAQFHETPCGVLTKSGERVDLAIVSLQKHAPFEDWRHYRLASEIEDIYPSPYALPLPVRIATSNADESRMGFAPTLVDLPCGKTVILNWTQNFLVRDGCDASAVVVSRQQLDVKNLPAIQPPPKNVTHFVADPPTEWETEKRYSNPKPTLDLPKGTLVRKLVRFITGG
jgi:hypothetical protein